MDFKVVVTKDAENDLERFIRYFLYEKESVQAAENVLNDYDAVIENLNHRYFMLYRIVDHVVFVDNIFHELQDYENKMR